MQPEYILYTYLSPLKFFIFSQYGILSLATEQERNNFLMPDAEDQ